MNEQTPALNPCPHIKRALERLARGERGGVYLWYARLHTIRCARCRAALEALKSYFAHLRSPLPESDVDLDRLRAGLESVDRER
ncbi:MAG: hypothetical protein WD716_02145 [Fimbriimonadaceae bacterium]